MVSHLFHLSASDWPRTSSLRGKLYHGEPPRPEIAVMRWYMCNFSAPAFAMRFPEHAAI